MWPLPSLACLLGASCKQTPPHPTPDMCVLIPTAVLPFPCVVQLALTMLGLCYLALNFVLEAVRLVIMQFLLQGKSFSTWQSLKYIAWPSAIMLFSMSAVFESAAMKEKNAGACGQPPASTPIRTNA